MGLLVCMALAPVVVFDREDDLQHRYLQARAGSDVAPPVHYVPASADYVAAVVPGGRAPEFIRNDEDARRIVRHFFDRDAPVAALCHGPMLPARACMPCPMVPRAPAGSWPKTSRPFTGQGEAMR